MVTTQSTSADSLLPISLATVSLTATVGINIYLKSRDDEPAALFCAAHSPVTRTRLEELLRDGCTKLYIQPEDRELYQQTMRESWQELLMDQQLPIMDRVCALQDVIRNVLDNEFRSGTTDSIVESCQSLGVGAVELIGDGNVLVREMSRVLHHDYGTFTHSTNVSAYAVLLGRSLGFATKELEEIAVGGLIHDLGKLDIDQQIINKPGRLDDSERRQIEQHPTLGLQRVAERDDLSLGSIMMIYQHHERMNGQGYPVGIPGDQIHPWGRLCAIVDVYEALTSNRPYRAALSSQTAMTILDKGCGTEFDEEMLKCWRQLVLN